MFRIFLFFGGGGATIIQIWSTVFNVIQEATIKMFFIIIIQIWYDQY